MQQVFIDLIAGRGHPRQTFEVSKTVAIVCVRMGSERLPGKMMLEVAGKPMLGHLINRVKQVKGIDSIVIAAPESSENDVIEKYCKEANVSCFRFRGPEDDVLGRMVGAFEQEKADTGVMIYGDSPLIDPRLVEECLHAYKEGGFDWVGNDRKNTYPSGMFTETFSIKALRNSASKTSDPAVREHGTLYIRQHPDEYKQKDIEAPSASRRPDVHLDIDSEEDFALFENLLNHFAPRNDFSLTEILAYLDGHPDIAKSNQHVHRRWKQYQQQ